MRIRRIFKFAFPGKFLQTNRNVRDLLLPPLWGFDKLTNLQLIFCYSLQLIFCQYCRLIFSDIFWKNIFTWYFCNLFFCYSLQLILGQSFRIIFLANHVNLFFWYFLQQFFPLIFLQIFFAILCNLFLSILYTYFLTGISHPSIVTWTSQFFSG